MKIQEQDTYHGPALMQIVEHHSFKALNKADERYGHYLVNKDTRLWLKYSSATLSPWTFTFQPVDLAGLAADIALNGTTHIVLACGHHTLCCLDEAEIRGLVEMTAGAQQWVKVEAPAGKQMRITGSLNTKRPTLAPHNKFPNCIF